MSDGHYFGQPILNQFLTFVEDAACLNWHIRLPYVRNKTSYTVISELSQ